MSGATFQTLIAIAGLVLALVGIFFSYRSSVREQARKRETDLEAAEARGAASRQPEINQLRGELAEERDDSKQLREDKRDLQNRVRTLEDELRRRGTGR